jgi:hypothetical protein
VPRQKQEVSPESSSSVLYEFWVFFLLFCYVFVNLSLDMQQLLFLIFLDPVVPSFALTLLLYWVSKHF